MQQIWACWEHLLAWGRGSRETAEKGRPQRLCWGAWTSVMPPVDDGSGGAHSLVYLMGAPPESGNQRRHGQHCCAQPGPRQEGTPEPLRNSLCLSCRLVQLLSRVRLCNPTILHCLPEFAQTHVHCMDMAIGDAIQPSHPPSPPSPLSPPSFPASGSFLMSQIFASGGPSIAASASASVLLMNIQG